MDQNPPITAHEHDLLTPLSQTLLFAKKFVAVIDVSEKKNGWLNLELQSLHVIEKRSKLKVEKIKPNRITRYSRARDK